MPPDLNLAQPIGHGLVTQAVPSQQLQPGNRERPRGGGREAPLGFSSVSLASAPPGCVPSLSARPTAPSPSLGV